MKRLIFLSVSLAALFVLAGCKKFLTETSQDEIRPSTVSDLVALMAGDGYPYQTNLSPILDLISDNVQCNGGQGNVALSEVVRKGRAPFTWMKNLYQEALLPGGLATAYLNSWQTMYGKIAGCNTVIAYIDRVSGTETEKNNLRGQALTMRAYYYFVLVNMYGKPYNAEGVNPETSSGVPLKLRMEVTDSLYPRNTVAEVYAQIEADLKAGLKYMKDYPQNNNTYKMNPLAAYAMLSRLYLYQEKWEQAIAYADSVIAVRPNLTQLSTYKGRPIGGYYLFNNGTTFEYSNRIYDPILSKEIIWQFSAIGTGTGSSEDEVFRSSVFSAAYSNTIEPPYSVSNSLLSLYETRPLSDTAVYLGDLRLRTYFLTSLYFVTTSPVVYGFKFYGGSKGVGGDGLRVSEMYLNRAEAKIQMAIKNANVSLLQTALNDLNTLRSARYDARRPYSPVVITDAQQLLTFCKEERRREFPLEGGHRWFDLRRWGMPSISHFYEEDPGTGQTYTLEKGDSRYILPIPNAVLERNAMISQNP